MASASQSTMQFARRDPEVGLMLRIREDEPGAFQELVEAYQDRLTAILIQMCGSREEAEDLAQEVFLRVYRARKDYHPRAKLSTWIFTIANNLALNALRRRKRKSTVNLVPRDSGEFWTRPEEQLAVNYRDPSPSQNLKHQELSEIVHMALSKLNERQRAAVLLCKFEDMSYQEISEVLETTPKAVKSLLNRARMQLREHLREYVEETQPVVEEVGT